MSSEQLTSIKEKVFIVTGGAAGVGAGLVRALLVENARTVAFLDIAEREGAALEVELSNKFGPLRAKFIKCDIADESQLLAAYNLVVNKYNRLDCVINNAAVVSADDFMSGKIIDINFKGTVSSTYKALSTMGAHNGGQGGTIVNMSSLLALQHTSHLPVYAATKLAVLQFTNSLGTQDQYSKTQVRVMTVCLGPTDTAILLRQTLANFEKDCTQNLMARVPERQRIESAVTGILEIIRKGLTGTIWMVAADKPPLDITQRVNSKLQDIAEDINTLLV